MASKILGLLFFVSSLLSLNVRATLLNPQPPGNSENGGGGGGVVGEDGAGSNPCKCVPDQFEAILISKEREIDFERGQSKERISSLMVHYDYANRKFASTEMDSGVKTIVDYVKGLKFSVKEAMGDCRVVATKEKMPQMCLPEKANLVAEYRLGFDVPVSVWTVSGSGNTDMSTTVDMRNCLPVSEEMFLITQEYSSTTFSVYANLSLGIRDEKVFDAPKSCLKVSGRVKSKSRKNFLGNGRRR